MRQYNQIKAKYPETVLLYRLGDFFETFGDDAKIAAKICGLTLTKRNNGAGGEMPLAGFPHHQLDSYLPKLVKSGYRVAVCEQLEDPKAAKGIVKRGVVEVVTPGVALYDKMLDTKSNNYVAAIYLKKEKPGGYKAGFSACDISTGEFFAGETTLNRLKEVLETTNPSEVIISKKQSKELDSMIAKMASAPSVTRLEEWIFEQGFADDLFKRQFETRSLKGFGIAGMDEAIIAAGAVLHYISETQQGNLEQIRFIRRHEPSEFMALDNSTRRNLEITWSMSDNSSGTLISILDKTCTAMGGRLFKKWISHPLKRLELIKLRLGAVSEFFNNPELRAGTRELLNQTGDIERLIAKACSGRATPRDAISLKNSLLKSARMKELLTNNGNPTFSAFMDKFNDVTEAAGMIERAIIDEPAAKTGNGNVFKEGYNTELDGYIEAKYSGKSWIAKYQEKERADSGIPTLKVGFNNVFGYYIEITKVHSSKVPARYERKQTLTNSERYTTPEIKEIESKIFGAEENIQELENRLFRELLAEIAVFTEKIQENASIIAAVDCLQGFAESAQEYNYSKPSLEDSHVLKIDEGRHPVVEKTLPVGEKFTPNSTLLDKDENQIHILTGPNMSGKSCYLRQVALIVLLAQIGSYVPAKSAQIGIVDRIFTRVGAQDNLSLGESTFLVEMQEAANIMNNATDRSLILLDEVGRGTATFDGISIAWAIAEHIHHRIGAKTLFATHYHELNDLSSRYERIKNFKVEILDTGSDIIFTHKVVEGASDHSFGIHVAKMAGMPYEVVERAEQIMNILESGGQEEQPEQKDNHKKAKVKAIPSRKEWHETNQLAIFEIRDDRLRQRLAEIKIENMTPIQAFHLLSELHAEANKPG